MQPVFLEPPSHHRLDQEERRVSAGMIACSHHLGNGSVANSNYRDVSESDQCMSSELELQPRSQAPHVYIHELHIIVLSVLAAFMCELLNRNWYIEMICFFLRLENFV